MQGGLSSSFFILYLLNDNVFVSIIRCHIEVSSPIRSIWLLHIVTCDGSGLIFAHPEYGQNSSVFYIRPFLGRQAFKHIPIFFLRGFLPFSYVVLLVFGLFDYDVRQLIIAYHHIFCVLRIFNPEFIKRLSSSARNVVYRHDMRLIGWCVPSGNHISSMYVYYVVHMVIWLEIKRLQFRCVHIMERQQFFQWWMRIFVERISRLVLQIIS